MEPTIVASILAAGLWPSILVIGCMLLADQELADQERDRTEKTSPVGQAALRIVIGMVPWSAVMLVTAVLGLYSPACLGTIGWAAVVGGCLFRPVRLRVQRTLVATLDEPFFIVVLAELAFFYLLFPSETILGGWDMGTYTNHAMFIAREGRLDIPYPWAPEDDQLLYPAMIQMPGFYKTTGSMTVQFGHLYPLWLAQAYGSFGSDGLFRLNAVLAILALAVFYGMALELMPPRFALVAALFLGINAGQVWVARTNLTEILAQLLLWSAIWCLFCGFRRPELSLLRWSGILFACGALVRIDSFLILPFLIGAYALSELVGSTLASRSLWNAFLIWTVPGFAAALVYYLLFSTPYVLAHRPQLLSIALLLVGMLAVWLAVRLAPSSWRALAHRWLTVPEAMLIVGIGLAVVLGYAYFVRPHLEPFATLVRPDEVPRGDRDYREDSLVNLARYVSFPAVVVAAIGWYLVLRRGIREHSPPLFALITLFTGVAAVYLWQPSVFPEHFWAIRRFVPVIIPGLILFAAYGMEELIRPLRHRLLLESGIALLLISFGIWANLPFWFVAEHRGIYAEMSKLADNVPADQVVFAHGSWRWAIPSAVAFDRKIVPLNLATKKGQDALRSWAKNHAGEPVYVLTDSYLDLPGLVGEGLMTTSLHDVFIRGTLHPLPMSLHSQVHVVHLFRFSLKTDRVDKSS